MKKYVVFTLLALTPLCAFAQSPSAELAFYKKQLQSDNKHQLDAAAQALDAWLNKNYSLPEAQEALLTKAEAELKAENYDCALLDLLKFKYEYPTSKNLPAAAKLYEQAVQNANKKYSDALFAAWAKKVNGENTEQRLDNYLYAVTKLDLKGTYEPVSREYINFFARFALYNDKDRVELMYGDWQRQNKNYQAALMQYAKVYETYPSTPYKAAALRMTADVYASELKDYPQAEKLYKEILEKYPTSVEVPTVYHHMAILAENQRDYQGAAKYLSKASEGYLAASRQNDAYETLRYKAQLEEKRLKDYAAAAATLDSAAKVFAQDEQKFIDIKLASAEVYAKRLKNAEEELNCYKDILGRYPSSAASEEVYFKAGKASEDMEKYPQAMAYYQNLIVNFPSGNLAIKAQRRLSSLEKKGYSPAAENTVEQKKPREENLTPAQKREETEEEDLLIEEVSD